MRRTFSATLVLLAAATLPLSARAQDGCPRGTSRHGDVCLPSGSEVAPAAAYPAVPGSPADPGAAAPVAAPVAGYPAVPGSFAPSAAAPAVFAAAVVPVRFEMDDGSEYEVSVDDLPGAPACRTPCELLLPPGKHRLHFVGAKVFDKKVKIPKRPALVRAHVRSSLATGLGIAGVGVGAATAVGSYVYLLVSIAEDAGDGRIVGGHVALGVGGMVVGTAVAVGSAISGFVINRTRVPVRLDDRRAEAPGPRLVGLSALPTREGGVLVGAAFEF